MQISGLRQATGIRLQASEKIGMLPDTLYATRYTLLPESGR